MRRFSISRLRASNAGRAIGAGLLCAAGSLAVKYAPAQFASMTGQPQLVSMPAIAPAGPADSGFVGIARQVTPAVVYIEAEMPARATSRQQLPPGLPPDFLPPGFGNPNGRGRGVPQRASGSGFIVSGDGEILTNNHVVEDASRLIVTLYDRRIFPAKVIGRDPSTDVALIKIDASGLPTLPLGDDGPVQVGQPVLAIGAPLGLRSTVTSGIISAKERGGDLRGLFNTDLAVVDFLQTDAVINPGNSGGPLLDMSGRVIGINSAIESPTGVYAGYGFAVPVSIARIAMDQFHKYGRVKRAILGVGINDVSAADAQAAGLKEIRGALVGSFSTDASAAKKAGLQQGDIILSIDGKPVSSVATLQRTVYGYRPGQTVTVGYARFGTNGTATVTLMEAEEEKAVASNGRRNDPADDEAGSTPASKLGITVQPVSPQLAAQYKVPESVRGVAVKDVNPSGPAARLIVEGDVITAVIGRGGAQRAILTGDQLKSAVDGASNGVISLVVYNAQNGPNGGTRVVNVPLDR